MAHSSCAQRQPAPGYQLGRDGVGQSQQVGDVGSGVGDLGWRQGAAVPVGEPVAFGQAHVQETFC